MSREVAEKAYDEYLKRFGDLMGDDWQDRDCGEIFIDGFLAGMEYAKPLKPENVPAAYNLEREAIKILEWLVDAYTDEHHRSSTLNFIHTLRARLTLRRIYARRKVEQGGDLG